MSDIKNTQKFAKECRLIANKSHKNDKSTCVEKVNWSTSDGRDRTDAKIYCASCGTFSPSFESFKEKHGGD